MKRNNCLVSNPKSLNQLLGNELSQSQRDKATDPGSIEHEEILRNRLQDHHPGDPEKLMPGHPLDWEKPITLAELLGEPLGVDPQEPFLCSHHHHHLTSGHHLPNSLGTKKLCSRTERSMCSVLSVQESLSRQVPYPSDPTPLEKPRRRRHPPTSTSPARSGRSGRQRHPGDEISVAEVSSTVSNL